MRACTCYKPAWSTSPIPCPIHGYSGYLVKERLYPYQQNPIMSVSVGLPIPNPNPEPSKLKITLPVEATRPDQV